MATTNSTTTRNYKDNFSFKDFTVNTLIPKFFPDEDISTLNTGLMGLITESTAITTEDTFNTVSTIIKEFFPNKASLPETIYNYAALFQMSSGMGAACVCKFLLVFSEDKLASIFEKANLYATSENKNCIYLSKNTKIYVENIPFVLDYDVEITRKKTMLADTEYVYSAKYVTTPYTNSISTITNPYIKIRRSIDNYLSLEVVAHQCIRYEESQKIIDNTMINYPTIDFTYADILGGIDVFYRETSDDQWTQLDLLVENSLPQKDPFCYYKVIDEGVLRISFSTTDSYFQPKFNSEVKVVMYLTKGSAGKFDQYTGSDVPIVCDSEEYEYNQDFIIAAMPTTPSTGGCDVGDIEELRRLVVEQFSTANAMTTDNDLEMYFNNYELRNDNRIKFIKRRDDLAERLYTGFLIMCNEDFIYSTNTLDIALNYLEWSNPDGGYIYTLDPGHIFMYEENTNRVHPCYKDGLYTKKTRYNMMNQTIYEWLYRDYFKWLMSLHEEYKMVIDLDAPEKWIPSKTTGESFKDYLKLVHTCKDCGYRSYPMTTTKDGEYICTCCGSTNIDTSGVTASEYMLTVFDTNEITEIESQNNFLFANPFLISVTKHPGVVNYYLTIINQTSTVDFIDYNSDMPLQFIMQQCNVLRPLNQDKEYEVRMKLMSSADYDVEYLIPGIKQDDYVGKRSQCMNNYLRVIMAIEHNGEDSCYIEMVPESINKEGHITFAVKFRTTDHVTNGNMLQLDEYTISELGYIPPIDDPTYINETWFSTNEDYNTLLYTEPQNSEKTYVSDGSPFGYIHEDNRPENDTDGEEIPDTSSIHGNFVYVTNKQDHLIPMTDVNVKFYILHKDIESDTNPTNNYRNNATKFKLRGFSWTNLYDTSSDRVDFIKPLTMIRTPIYFRDTRLNNVTDGDVYMYSSPFVKYSLLTHYNADGSLKKDGSGNTNFDMFNYFINQFYLQYEHMEEVLTTTLRNASHIDLKFYNTYGRSNNYIIGDSDEIIDRVNMSISFYVYLISGTDPLKASDEIKTFIKEYIEVLNQYGSNDMNISNLIREIENNFAYVDHLRFCGINGEVQNGVYTTNEFYGYSTDYQTIRNVAIDLDDLTKDERYAYVPEMLCVNKDQIVLTMFEV